MTYTRVNKKGRPFVTALLAAWGLLLVGAETEGNHVVSPLCLGLGLLCLAAAGAVGRTTLPRPAEENADTDADRDGPAPSPPRGQEAYLFAGTSSMLHPYIEASISENSDVLDE